MQNPGSNPADISHDFSHLTLFSANVLEAPSEVCSNRSRQHEQMIIISSH